ncbi:MAG: aminodeoxychorismate/anthranilate synthase component II [Cellvibrionaceae bacterium]|nr:aminodeoxychorismate/anthranilate synthase component II [Cellvibrionaceae bacterium]
MKVLIIDNYDSFTFNLYQYVGEILTQDFDNKIDIIVKRNDDINIDEAKQINPDKIIISPGPGTPEQQTYFGVCADIIRELGKTTPLMGVCLGMQGIAHCFGGRIIPATIPVHGKTSNITHDNKGVFSNIPQDIEAMRYHSLIVETASLPGCFDITATTATAGRAAKSDQIIMGIRHKVYPMEGIQFHPESFATEGSKNILKNFLS